MRLTPVIRRRTISPFKTFFEEVESMMSEENFQTNNIFLDVIENQDNFEIYADLPGFKKEDINIEAENNQLTIEVINNEQSKKNSKNYIVRERNSGYFKRILSLGNSVNTQKIEASLTNGILRLFYQNWNNHCQRKFQSIRFVDYLIM